MAYDLGTPAIDHYGNTGFISAVLEPTTKAFIVGAGMKEITKEYEVCFENGRVTVLPDGIVAPFVKRAEGLPKVTDVESRKAEIRELERAKKDAAERERVRQREERAAFELEAAKRVPSWAKAVIVAELMEDDSDPMTDYFNSKVTRTVILGFSKHTRDLFPELRKAAAEFAETADLATADESAEHREKYSMGAGYYLKAWSRHSDGWKVRKVQFYDDKVKSMPSGEWLEPKSVPVAESVASPAIEGIRIEEHTHTKKGFLMSIVILSERVDRDEFGHLLSVAKDMGGWYSKAWGTTPGGFAFKDRSKAEEFAAHAGKWPEASQQPAKTVEPSTMAERHYSKADAPKPTSSHIADKLEKLADSMQREIDGKFADRLTNTPKRQREAASARNEGYRLKRTQEALRALADLHRRGEVPPVLASVTSKAKAFELMRSEIEWRGGYYDAGVDTGKPALSTPEALALWALIEGVSEAEKAAEALRRKIAGLQFSNIPGYFPTPADIVADMIDAADIPEGESVDVLEPEAGSGAILDGIKEARPLAVLHAYERHSTLREILTAKGFTLDGSDFLEATPAPIIDRVLMNPPFENGQDIDHVLHAFRFLKAGGRLVAIMSAGVFYRSDKKAVAFRDWLESRNGSKTDIPAGAFKESGTGVATVLITVDA